MKAYIITIIGATLLSAVAGILAPEKWRVSPSTSIVKSDIFDGFEHINDNIVNSDDVQSGLVLEELKKRINADISERMEKEYNLNVKAECEIRLNSDGEIEGVESVRVSGDKLTDRARLRLCEVYGLKPYEVYDE